MMRYAPAFANEASPEVIAAARRSCPAQPILASSAQVASNGEISLSGGTGGRAADGSPPRPAGPPVKQEPLCPVSAGVRFTGTAPFFAYARDLSSIT